MTEMIRMEVVLLPEEVMDPRDVDLIMSWTKSWPGLWDVRPPQQSGEVEAQVQRILQVSEFLRELSLQAEQNHTA